MWCKACNREIYSNVCIDCGSKTEKEIPVEIFWCTNCEIPIIKSSNAIDKTICSLCGDNTSYMSVDLRPVFPEERLLFEILTGTPFDIQDKSVWANGSCYYINNKTQMLNSKIYEKVIPNAIIQKLDAAKETNTYKNFNEHIGKFIIANQDRLNYLKNEACSFIQSSSKRYSEDSLVVSFSGGKDSTVVADLVVRALSNPSIVHIFGDTTLEFPLTMEYVKRFRKDNPKVILKTAKNKEQNFYEVCKDIGPPARMLRWCCSMFKTGPITRVLNNLYQDSNVLTYYGIRKCESASRSKYNRIEDGAEFVKIKKQTVASPIFFWKDIDIWLYILAEKIDFNDAYRLGYDRVGCWCCPNNGLRAQFLSKIYMPARSEEWRKLLISFAQKIGKPDAEVYVDTGKWKARQGGNGVVAANDIKIHFANCTTETNSRIYHLNKPAAANFYDLFIPFGKISTSLGRKLIGEIIVLDIKTKVPIISIQPFRQAGYEYAVKIKTMNVKSHNNMQRVISYQILKYNACRKCLKCESICKFGAISITRSSYKIDANKCKRCKMCINAKYLEGGCLMKKYLYVRDETRRA